MPRDNPPYDPLLPCTVPTEEWWHNHLFGDLFSPEGSRQGPSPVSRMSQAAKDVFEKGWKGQFSYGDAWDCAQDFSGEKFRKLLEERDPAYNCAQFKGLVRQGVVWHAIALGLSGVKHPSESIDAVIETESGDFNLHGVLEDFDEGFDRPLLEDDARCVALALDDLSERERLLVVALQEADDPRKVEGTQQQKCRAREHFNTLYRVHEQNESKAGAHIIDLVVSRRVEDPRDQELARKHLFDAQSLDCLRDLTKKTPETVDGVRHRFLRIAELIDPMCGGLDFERAFYLSPETTKATLREREYLLWPSAADHKMPAAGTWLEFFARERSALCDLATLYHACECRWSPKGRTSLFYRGKRAGEPSATLIKRLIINREIVEIVARELNLTEERARELLLAALRDTETKQSSSDLMP